VLLPGVIPATDGDTPNGAGRLITALDLGYATGMLERQRKYISDTITFRKYIFDYHRAHPFGNKNTMMTLADRWDSSIPIFRRTIPSISLPLPPVQRKEFTKRITAMEYSLNTNKVGIEKSGKLHQK
jgi:hypothetical protein